jgi:hypothetical protein
MNKPFPLPPLWKRIWLCLTNWREWQACLKFDRDVEYPGYGRILQSNENWFNLWNK